MAFFLSRNWVIHLSVYKLYIQPQCYYTPWSICDLETVLTCQELQLHPVQHPYTGYQCSSVLWHWLIMLDIKADLPVMLHYASLCRLFLKPLDMFFHMWCCKSQIEGNSHFPWLAVYALTTANTKQAHVKIWLISRHRLLTASVFFTNYSIKIC